MSCLDSLKNFHVDEAISFIRCDIDRNITQHCNITELASQVNMTMERVSGVLEEFLDLECWNYALSVVKVPQQAVQGWLALILFSLMLATLWKLRATLSPSILIYHAATAIFEYPIAVNGILVGHLTYHTDDPSYNRIWAFAVWRNVLSSGWAIGDTFKLALSCLTFFLCLDRFCAVCIPVQLRKINRSAVAIIATCVSLLIGTSHLWNVMFLGLTRMPDGQYMVRINNNYRTPGLIAWNTFLLGFTATARLVSCGGIFVLSVCTVIGLKKRAKKIHSMTSAAQEEESRITKFTKMTLITAMCVLIDHVPWIAGRYWGFTAYSSRLSSNMYFLLTRYSYEDIERRAYYGRVSLALYHLAVWATWFLHGIRFLVYLAFDKTMRDGFLKIFRREQQQQYSSHISERSGVAKETTEL